MATIFDLIEVTYISQHTTYSQANGNLLGVADGAVSSEFDDGEFDERDVFVLDGVAYRIDLIQEPSSSGRFTAADGTNLSFDPQSESNLDVIFLTVSNASETRHFILPSDRYGDLKIAEIRTGELTDVGGSDAALVSTRNDDVSVVCFCAGTKIRLGNGSDIAVEALKIGDDVETLDRGAQTVRWVGGRSVPVTTMLRYPKLRPVFIPSGALGPNVPEHDLYVSPQHRVLVRSRIAGRMFETDEVLMAAKHLVGVNGIRTDQSAWNVTYLHVLLDHHEILLANGAFCESLLLGPQGQRSLGAQTMKEIAHLLSVVRDHPSCHASARPLIQGRRARRLAQRHLRNRKCLCHLGCA